MSVSIHKRIRGANASEIARSVETILREGGLAPEDRLPPVRQLAARLEVSPTTVAAAYRTLGARGLVIGDGRRGTRVAPKPPLRTRAPAPLAPDVRDLASGNPDPALLPDLAPALARIDSAHHLYGDAFHDPELLRLAERLLRDDGLPAERVTVTSGALDAIERVLAAHLRPGDRVAVEDPGFTAVYDLVSALGLVAVPCSLDAEGPLPDSLAAVLAAGVAAVIVTPRAQNPTGAALSPARARALRTRLRAHPEVLLIEDDHAGEVAGAALQTLWQPRHQRFALVRSLSKTLGPDLRIALLSSDPLTAARVEGRQHIGLRWVSHLLQRLAVELWSSPRTQRALARAEGIYTERREGLLRALSDRGVVASGGSGFNVWVPVPEEAAAVQALLGAGFAVAAGERFRLRSGPALRITTATLEAAEAAAVADVLSRSLAPSGRVAGA